MATTAIFAELLVIGLEALCWISLLALTWIGDDQRQWLVQFPARDWMPLITAATLAAAYVIGIFVDRVADSVFTRLDVDWNRHGNLPLSRARLTVMSKNKEVAMFLDYIRSRERIARATCFNLFAGTIALALFLGSRGASPLAIAGTVVAGVLVAFAALLVARRISKAYYHRLMDAYEIVTGDAPKPPDSPSMPEAPR